MDWQNWVPREEAVLCFIVREGRVLLIRKKRGLGAGKVNAPGGKIDPGETPVEAAVRETREEVGVTPRGLTECALLHFQFADGYSLRCTAFFANDAEGEPYETAEAAPFWVPVEAIPYGEMWDDDRYWLPLALEGKTLSAFFEFDGESMRSQEVRVREEFVARGRRVLVAGCGFLGLATARLLAQRGWEVTGCTHTAASREALAGEPFRAVAADISRPEELARLELPPPDAVIHCASSGRGGVEAYRQVYVAGARNLVEAFSAPLIFTSSTSVYAQTDGEWVTEESPAEPSRETGRALREAEEIALAAGGAVARLAGIYGPRRSVLLKKFLSGEAVIEGDGRRWLNQIHRDDAAAALMFLVETGARGIFNVADDTPLAQRALYEGLAARLNRPLPPEGPIDAGRKRGWTHKRVSNAKLRALGWRPCEPSFFDALARDPDLTLAAE